MMKSETYTMQQEDMRGLIYSTCVDVDDVSLVVIDGPYQGVELHLKNEVTSIGRDDWCDLSLPLDTWVSGQHCEVWLEKGQVRVRDLNSRNGIFLGGHRVFEAFLTPNVPLKLGDTILELRSHKSSMQIEVHHLDASGHLVGCSQQMRKMFSLLPRLAQRDVTVLTSGETGTRKVIVGACTA